MFSWINKKDINKILKKSTLSGGMQTKPCDEKKDLTPYMSDVNVLDESHIYPKYQRPVVQN